MTPRSQRTARRKTGHQKMTRRGNERPRKAARTEKVPRTGPRRARKRSKEIARSEVGEQKPAATPTKESNAEEKRELRARLEVEQLRARMWQELSEANSLAEEGSEQKTTTPCRRGARTPLTGQTTKKSEEDEGRGMNVADALRRAGENNGQDDSETQ